MERIKQEKTNPKIYREDVTIQLRERREATKNTNLMKKMQRVYMSE